MEFEALRQNERREKEKFSYNSLIPRGDKETEDWYDYKKLPEEIPQFPYFRRMLLGADSVVHTPRLRAFETNVSKMAKISDLMSKTWKIRGRMGQVGPGANYHARQGRLSRSSKKVMSMKPERVITGKLLTRTAIAPFGCAEIVTKHRGGETGQQAT